MWIFIGCVVCFIAGAWFDHALVPKIMAKFNIVSGAAKKAEAAAREELTKL